MRYGRCWDKHGLRYPSPPTCKLFVPILPTPSNNCRMRWEPGVRRVHPCHKQSRQDQKRAVGLPLGLCISSDPDDDLPEVPSILEPIVSEWQRLASMDKQSPDFLFLLSTLTTGVDRPSTIKLQDENARIVLGVLDEVRTSSA